MQAQDALELVEAVAIDEKKIDGLRLRFDALFREHHDRIWQFLRRMGLENHEADDATQDAFMLLSRHIRHIKEGEEYFYLLGAARKVAAGYRRKRNARTHLESKLLQQPQGENVTLEKSDEVELLDKALEVLPENLRVVLVMTELEGLERAEIARLINIPPGTVASRLRRAREVFEDELRRLQNEFSSIGVTPP